MSFAHWLKEREQQTAEASTSTGDVANFARPIGIGSTREFPEPITFDDDKKKKHAQKNPKNL